MKVYVSRMIRAGDFVSINRFRWVYPTHAVSGRFRNWWRMVALRERVWGIAKTDLQKGWADSGDVVSLTSRMELRMPIGVVSAHPVAYEGVSPEWTVSAVDSEHGSVWVRIAPESEK